MSRRRSSNKARSCTSRCALRAKKYWFGIRPEARLLCCEQRLGEAVTGTQKEYSVTLGFSANARQSIFDIFHRTTQSNPGSSCYIPRMACVTGEYGRPK